MSEKVERGDDAKGREVGASEPIVDAGFDEDE